MAIQISLPGSGTLLTAAKIEAALGGTPLLLENLEEYVVTGITFNGDEEVHKGVVDVTLEALGLEKLEDFDPETVLDALTRESIENLLGNEAFSAEENNGIYDILTDIVELLGMDGEEGAEESLLKRVQDLEAEAIRLEEDKMDKDDFNRKAVEELLGVEDYEEGKGLLDQITKNAGDISDLQTGLASANEEIEDIKEALGLDDEADGEGSSILDRLEAVEGKATQNASDIKDIQDQLGELDLDEEETLADVIKDLKDKDGELEGKVDDLEEALGDLGLEDDQTLADVIEDLKDKDSELEGKITANAGDIEDIQDALGLDKNYDPEEDGTIADRLDAVEKQASDNKTATETNASAIEQLQQDLEDLETAADDTYLKAEDFTRDAILTKIADTLASSDDKYINYTLPKTAWSTEMIANEEYDAEEAEKGDYDVPETVASGFQVCTIKASDLGLETLGDPDNINIEIMLQNDCGFVPTLCASEAIITSGTQTENSFTLKAINEVYADLPLTIVIDKLAIDPVTSADDEEEEEAGEEEKD